MFEFTITVVRPTGGILPKRVFRLPKPLCSVLLEKDKNARFQGVIHDEAIFRNFTTRDIAIAETCFDLFDLTSSTLVSAELS